MDFEREIASLKDTLLVMAELERHLAEAQILQAQLLGDMREGMALHEKRMAHIELNLEEITDKLNGLIGFMDGFTRGGGRPQ